jgi:DNA polymerase-4
LEQDDAVKQLDLFSFEQEAKKEPLYHTMEMLREKYGKHIIEKAGDLRDYQKSTPTIGTDTSFNKDFLQTSSQSWKKNHDKKEIE